MIYYKKKSLIKKIINNLKTKTQNKNSSVLSFLKNFLILIFIITSSLYASYLYLIPNYANKENIEKFIENHISKNTNLRLDIENLKINPDYKLNLNIQANSATLKYPNHKEFITIKNPSIDINLLSLLYGYIDLNKIEIDKTTIYTSFTKENKYTCFNYFNANNKKSKFKLKNINLKTKDLFQENPVETSTIIYIRKIP